MSGRRGWRLTVTGLACAPLLVLLAAVTPTTAAASTAVPCSAVALVTAINTANGASGGALDLAAGCTYTFTIANNVTDLPGTATPVITTAITINGNGAIVTRSTSAATAFRLFDVGSGGNLTLNNTTVSNGSALGNGGGILNAASLTLSADTITGNIGSGVDALPSAAAFGIDKTAITNNSQNGIFNQSSSTVTVTGGSISGSPAGAGILSNGDVSLEAASISANLIGVQTTNSVSNNLATISNSTLTTGQTGLVAAHVAVTNSTLEGFQTALLGSGTVTESTIADISVGGVVGADTITDSILSSNGGANCSGTVTDGGHNVSFPVTDTTCPTTFTSGDPKLDILRDNGGPTQTMALLDGSVAAGLTPVGAPGCTAADTDQRGVPRLQSGQPCDAGAFELVSTTTIMVQAVASQTAGGPVPVILGATVTPFSTIPGVPSGTLSFYNGATLLATVPLVNGGADFRSTTLPAGTYTMVARFPGARGFLASSSAPVIVVVAAAVTPVPSVGSAPDLPAPAAPALLVLAGLGLVAAARRGRRQQAS